MDANNGNQSEFQFSADEIGFELARQYYAVLDRMPEQAWRFYTELGEHRTIYEDDTVVVASTRREVQRMLLLPTPSCRDYIAVDKVTTIPCDDSMDRLMVLITGVRYSQTFVVEYQNSGKRSYAIASSVTMFFPAKLAADPIPIPALADTVESRAGIKDDTAAATADATARHHYPAIANTLFVGNLLNTTTRQDLVNMFRVYGPVPSVRIKGCKDRDGNLVQFNYALIKFATPASATEALAHRPFNIDGRILDVRPKMVIGPRVSSSLA